MSDNNKKLTDNINVGPLMIRAAILRNISLFVAVISSFITLPMIINLLGDNWYGIWVIVGTFMGYFGLIDFGLTSATNRYLALHWKEKNTKEIGETFSTSFIGFCLLSVVVIIISIFAIILAPYFLEEETSTSTLRIVLLILAIDMAMTFPAAVYQSVLIVEIRNDITALLKMIQAIVRVGLIYWIVNINGTIIHIAIMTFTLNLLVRMAMIYIANGYLAKGTLQLKHFCLDKLKEYFHFGKFTFLGNIGDLLRFRLDVFVIGGMLGSALVVPYNIALVLVGIANEAAGNVISGTLPVFTKYYSEGRMDQIREKLFFLTRINITVATILSCSLLMIAQPFIVIWVGPDYLDAFIPLVILCSIAPLDVGQNSAIQIFFAISKHKYYAYINVIEAAFNLALSLLLVVKYGIIGVALGTAIPAVISRLIFVPYYICKFTEVPMREYLFNIAKPVFLILFLESGCLGLIIYYQIEDFLPVFILASIWQVLIGVILLKFIASKDDYSYAIETVPMLAKILRRPN